MAEARSAETERGYPSQASPPFQGKRRRFLRLGRIDATDVSTRLRIRRKCRSGEPLKLVPKASRFLVLFERNGKG